MEPQKQSSPQNTTNSINQENLSNNIESQHVLSRAERFKRSFFQILIGCLLGAAAIAVIAVLVGSFNDTLARALGTIAMVALHAILSFGYITETEKWDKKAGGRSIELFSNTIFVLIVASFITSIFAIWQLLDGRLTLKLYMSYGVLLFATLHADVLYRIRGFEKRIDNLVTANYFLMAIVVTMLFVVIFSDSPSDLGEFYYRLLAAVGITDATMTITAIIMHKLYLQKHPELAASFAQVVAEKSKNFWKNPLVILLLIFLAFQVIGTIVGLVFSGF
jgi:hypothetical protein